MPGVLQLSEEKLGGLGGLFRAGSPGPGSLLSYCGSTSTRNGGRGCGGGSRVVSASFLLCEVMKSTLLKCGSHCEHAAEDCGVHRSVCRGLGQIKHWSSLPHPDLLLAI